MSETVNYMDKIITDLKMPTELLYMNLKRLQLFCIALPVLQGIALNNIALHSFIYAFCHY